MHQYDSSTLMGGKGVLPSLHPPNHLNRLVHSHHLLLQRFLDLQVQKGQDLWLLSLVEPPLHNYVPKPADEDLPVCLTNCYKLEYRKLNYSKLLKESAENNIT